MASETCPSIVDPPVPGADAPAFCSVFWQQTYGSGIGSAVMFAAAQAGGFGATLVSVANTTEVLTLGDDDGRAIVEALHPLVPDEIDDPDNADDGDLNDVDDAYIAYFAGHGTPDTIICRAGNQAESILAGELRWGDGKLRWIVLDACNALSYAPLTNGGNNGSWRRAFAGVRYVLGWHSFAEDEPWRGARFAVYLNAGFPVRTAWRLACEETTSTFPCASGASEGDGRRWSYLRAKNTKIDTWCDRWDATCRADGVDAPLEFIWVYGPA